MDKANSLFAGGCTCGGIDIGVGQMHEPRCGLPTPDIIADALLEFRKEALEEIVEDIDRFACICWCLGNIDDTRPHDPTVAFCPLNIAQAIRKAKEE